MSTGAKKVFTAPRCVVKATTREGQRWVDITTERGISALGWKRPKQACQPDPEKAKPAEVKKKPPWWKRFKRTG